MESLFDCTGCGKALPATEFHNVSKWRRCKTCLCAKQRAKYHACPDTKRGIKVRNRTVLLSSYGLTWETFKAMLEQQDHSCAICGTELVDEVGAPRSKQACVDHCHATGRVRGLLCMNCNLAIGYLKDSIVIATNAIKYLGRKYD